MFARLASAATGGSIITLVLFWSMHQLIVAQPQVIAEGRDYGQLGIFKPREDSELIVDRLEPDFETLKEPLEPLPERSTPDHAGTRVTVGLPRQTGPADQHIDLEHAGIGDGPLVTMVRVQPTYPIRASERNLEGYVVVEFDVLADGTVSNVRVVESSHTIFERAAIEAAMKFRFKPQVVDGVPQPSFGLQNRFRFEMERG